MKTYNISELHKKFRNLTIDELINNTIGRPYSPDFFTDDELIVAIWKEAGIKVLEAIERQNAPLMSYSEFYEGCRLYFPVDSTTLGGQLYKWYPEVYRALPKDWGKFSSFVIPPILHLLNIRG